MDYGHLTLLLSDLVSNSGHVFATSKNPLPKLVKELIDDWMNRNGGEIKVDESGNVSLHSFDASDHVTATRLMRYKLYLKKALQMDNDDDEEKKFETQAEPYEDEDKNKEGVLDFIFALKLPETALQSVMEGAASLLKVGGSVGLIPLHFSHLQSLVDFIHQRRLPFYLEMVRQPQSHHIYSSLPEAEAAGEGGKEAEVGETGWREGYLDADRDSASRDDDDKRPSADEDSEEVTFTRLSQMGFPKDLRSGSFPPSHHGRKWEKTQIK